MSHPRDAFTEAVAWTLTLAGDAWMLAPEAFDGESDSTAKPLVRRAMHQ